MVVLGKLDEIVYWICKLSAQHNCYTIHTVGVMHNADSTSTVSFLALTGKLCAGPLNGEIENGRNTRGPLFIVTLVCLCCAEQPRAHRCCRQLHPTAMTLSCWQLILVVAHKTYTNTVNDVIEYCNWFVRVEIMPKISRVKVRQAANRPSLVMQQRKRRHIEDIPFYRFHHDYDDLPLDPARPFIAERIREFNIDIHHIGYSIY